MVNTSTKYIVYTHTGGGVRHHNFSTQNNIVDEANGTASSGDTLNALGFATLEFNGDNLPFAFMSVHGGADGNKLYTSPGNQTVEVGSNDIDILVVYAPPGGIGSGGGPGIWVDAFNVDTGAFSDSLDFIKVLNPPTPPDSLDAAKTTFGNQEGEISTTTAENVRAQDHVDGVPFVKWKRIVPTPTTQTDRMIQCAVNQTGQIWFAFYQTPKKEKPPEIKVPRVIEEIVGGIMIWTGDDFCGNGGHRIPKKGPGPSPFKISITREALGKLNPAQQKKLKGLTAKYPDAAQMAHEQMTAVVDILKSINEITKGIH